VGHLQLFSRIRLHFSFSILLYANSLSHLSCCDSHIVAVAPGSTVLNASASGRDADFPGSRGSGVSGT